MSQPQRCIYCGKPAGSGEHTFPAALGGRRRDRGILCHDCNHGFSPLDAELARQLSTFNALLGVIPDRRDEPNMVPAEDPRSGVEYLLDERGQPRLSGPTPAPGDDPASGARSFRYHGEAEAQAHTHAMRAEGIVVRRNGPPRPGRQYFIVPIEPEQISFGGLLGFREVGRIALNFLAQECRDVAGFGQLQVFKDFVTRDADQVTGQEPVWYDFEYEEAEPPQTFPFGHRLIVGLDANSHRAWGRVVFFSALSFGIDFGESRQAATSFRVVIDVNPLAERAAPGVDQARHAASAGYEAPPRAPRLVLEDLGTKVQPRLQALMERILREQRRKLADEILPAVNGAVSIPSGDARIQAIVRALGGHDQRILHVLVDVVAQLRDAADRLARDGLFARDHAARIAARLSSLVTADAQSENGLSVGTTSLLALVTHEVAQRISAHADQGGRVEEAFLGEALDGSVAYEAARAMVDRSMSGSH